MGLIKDVNGMVYDVRLLDWNLKYGNVTKEEIKKHKDALVDMSAACENITITDDDSDFDQH